MGDIALIADSQLGKRLYGLNETYNDWLQAFKQAGDYVANSKTIKAAIFLGDTFDAEAMYPKEIKTAQDVVSTIRSAGKEAYGILGNHDKGQSDIETITSWLNVVGITPLTTQGVEIGNYHFIGINHQNKHLLKKTLEELPKPTTSKKIAICLHQALKELSMLGGGWEVESAQVPQWVQRVFLGDFHNHCSYKDKHGREFMYPGAIETVSFNQETEPGFVVFCTKSEKYHHISTKQRDYIKFNLDKLGKNWLKTMTDVFTESSLKYNTKPVAQLISQNPISEEVKDFTSRHTIKYVTLEFGSTAAENESLSNQVPTTPEDVKALAVSELPITELGELAKRLLDKPESSVLIDWQKEKYPQITAATTTTV